MIAAIPTRYKGVQFRSRLEARWACFFDLNKIKWEYEPYDLDGWIPDFVLHGYSNSEILVEVKPIKYQSQELENRLSKYLYTDKEILILGNTPILVSKDGMHEVDLCAGWIGELTGDGASEKNFYFFQEAKWSVADAGNLDFFPAYGQYVYRISGEYNGGSPVIAPIEMVQSLWNEAGNEVQWMKPKCAASR